MTEKLNNILFHPSTLIEYRKTHLLKVLLYLLILTIFSLVVPIIETISSPELTLSDKEIVESMSGFDFDNANKLPNCSLSNKTLACKDDGSKQQEIGAGRMFVITTDLDDSLKIDSNLFYLKLTEKGVKIVDRNIVYIEYTYDELPTKWQQFNFETIKNASNPEEEFYYLFTGGLNQLMKPLVPVILGINILITFVISILETLFYALLFFMFYRRFNLRFKEIFKIAVFAQTFAITIGVILDLLRINSFSSFLITTITFIYIYIAILASVTAHKDQEF